MDNTDSCENHQPERRFREVVLILRNRGSDPAYNEKYFVHETPWYRRVQYAWHYLRGTNCGHPPIDPLNACEVCGRDTVYIRINKYESMRYCPNMPCEYSEKGQHYTGKPPPSFGF